MEYRGRYYKIVDVDGNEYEPPKIYDVAVDKIRLATQADIDDLVEQLKFLRDIQRAVRSLDNQLANKPLTTGTK